MSDYLKQLRDILKEKLQRDDISIIVIGSTMKISKSGQTIMTLQDKGQIVELNFQGKKYTYDKWYTKPPHLAQTILNVFQYQNL
ncbi:hypothetical protein [Pyrolobus fumarii]|uniref:hypothetical protein n=1 Tax=Pyrolobus fumarii TaxID=54252 RepID=UPI00064EC111|nr:hypothetical protein [Pyrolobus fumarii]